MENIVLGERKTEEFGASGSGPQKECIRLGKNLGGAFNLSFAFGEWHQLRTLRACNRTYHPGPVISTLGPSRDSQIRNGISLLPSLSKQIQHRPAWHSYQSLLGNRI